MVQLVIAAIGLGIQLWGLLTGEEAREEEEKSMRKQAEFEAYQSEQTAAELGVVAGKKERTIETQGRQFIGEQIASASGSGVRLDTGTSADLITESQRSIETDVTEMRRIYAKERTNLLQEAAFARQTGRALGSQSAKAGAARLLQGTGSILGQGATLADRWNQWKSTPTAA